jgi:tRNA(Phe) wybutosine-synthesizing methylase Tyw3
MPDIKIKEEIELDVNIDVYCGTCGVGLCGNTTVDNRRMSFTIEACPNCMEAKEKKIKELEKEVERLEETVCA